MARELVPDPFGEKPAPWWRSLLRSGGKGRAPKRYAGAAGALGPIVGLALQGGDGLDKPTRLAIVAGLTFLPPLLVESLWRARKRREEEGLLTIPATVGKESRMALGQPQGANKVQTCPTPFHDTGESDEERILSNRAKSPDSTTPQNTPKMGS